MSVNDVKLLQHLEASTWFCVWRVRWPCFWLLLWDWMGRAVKMDDAERSKRWCRCNHRDLYDAIRWLGRVNRRNDYRISTESQNRRSSQCGQVDFEETLTLITLAILHDQKHDDQRSRIGTVSRSM